MMRSVLAGLPAEFSHVATELRRRRGDRPRVPLPVAGVVTVLLVLWGNGVVLVGRHLDASDEVTLVAHPLLAIACTAILLQKGWRPGTLGFKRPLPEPASSRLRLLFGALVVATLAAAAVVLALDPSKRLDVVRLLLGTAVGEEVLHRSALLAVWASTSAPPAVIMSVSVAAFGLWHLAGALHGDAFHPLEVAVPAAGTLVFLWARLRYRSVAAPIIVHIATNLPGIVLGLHG